MVDQILHKVFDRYKTGAGAFGDDPDGVIAVTGTSVYTSKAMKLRPQHSVGGGSFYFKSVETVATLAGELRFYVTFDDDEAIQADTARWVLMNVASVFTQAGGSTLTFTTGVGAVSGSMESWILMSSATSRAKACKWTYTNTTGTGTIEMRMLFKNY